MARRSDHSREQLRALILAAARDLIEAGGVDALSTRKIADRIGYTSGTLYQHFKDINEIVLGVNALTLQGLIDAMVAAEPTLPADPERRIQAYGDIYVDYVTANSNAWDAMFAWRRPANEPVPDWYEHQIDTLVDMVAACFARMPSAPHSGSPQDAARLIWASVHSVCALSSGGRLDLIMRTELRPLVHKLVAIHVAAYLPEH